VAPIAIRTPSDGGIAVGAVELSYDRDYVTIARGANMTSSTIPWSHDLESALTDTRGNQRPILVDFTAAPM
jgi:hypothetical protein